MQNVESLGVSVRSLQPHNVNTQDDSVHPAAPAVWRLPS